MEVKIQCPCETRFAFDVEPVNGRMPVRVNCPGCGADRTDLANELIREKLAGAAGPAPAPPPVPVLLAVPAPPRQPPRVNVAEPAAEAAPVATATVTFCFRHLKTPAVETCRVCGKPICEGCMEQYGYACSVYCRKRAEETGMDLPVYGRHRAVIEARVNRVAAWIWRAALFLAVLFTGAWIWYTFFASHPRVIYSETLPHGDRARFYQFLVPNQVLLIKADQMSLFDVAQQQQLWSVPLNVGFYRPPPRDASLPDIEEPVRLYPQPRVVATTNDLWILFPGSLVQYDRHNGNRKQQIPLNPPFFGLAQSGNALTVIAADESGQQTMTRIALADGAVKVEPLKFANPAPPPSNHVARPPAASAPISPNNQLGRIIAATKSLIPANARTGGVAEPGRSVCGGWRRCHADEDGFDRAQDDDAPGHEGPEKEGRGRWQPYCRPESGGVRADDERIAPGADRRCGRRGRQPVSGHPAPVAGRHRPGLDRRGCRPAFLFCAQDPERVGGDGMSSRFSTRRTRNFGRPI